MPRSAVKCGCEGAVAGEASGSLGQNLANQHHMTRWGRYPPDGLGCSPSPISSRRTAMIRLRTTAVAFVSTLALGSFGAAAVPTAFADHATDAPCATQQGHVDKAHATLAALT